MPDDIKIIFSRNLSNQLYEKNKTQADICKRLGVSSATASDWCNGKKLPRLDKIQTICNWLGIEKSDLLEEKPKRLSKDDIAMLSQSVSGAQMILEDIGNHIKDRQQVERLHLLYGAYSELSDKTKREYLISLMLFVSKKSKAKKKNKFLLLFW